MVKGKQRRKSSSLELIEKTSDTYIEFYERLCGKKLEIFYDFKFSKTRKEFSSPEQELREMACGIFNSCVILCGSEKDIPHCNKIIKSLDKNIVHNLYVCSAHKQTEKLLKLLKRICRRCCYFANDGPS